MLLPHESTIGTGPSSALVPSESTRGIGFGDPQSDCIENLDPVSEKESGSLLSLEKVGKAEKKADDQRKISTNESKKKRVKMFATFLRMFI